jgi:uncharacterized protein (TIGR02271 family)
MNSDAEHDPDVVRLVEETLRLDKRQVSTGKVRISTVVDTVEEVARASLDEEKVEITRVPVDKVVEVAPAVRTEDGVTIVPVLEEVLFVEKRLVLREELHIRRRIETEDVEVPVTLRKERAVVETISPDQTDEDLRS